MAQQRAGTILCHGTLECHRFGEVVKQALAHAYQFVRKADYVRIPILKQKVSGYPNLNTKLIIDV